MKKKIVRLLGLAAILLAGLVPVVQDAQAKKPPAPCTNCAQTITLPDGRVCTLVACGSDCVYQCPF